MKNIIKGWVTSIVGITIYVVTLLMIYNSKLNWIWEGIIAMVFGTVLLFSPTTIEKWVNKIVNSKTKNKANEANP